MHGAFQQLFDRSHDRRQRRNDSPSLPHSERDQLGDATWLAPFEWLGSEKAVEIVSDPATSINAEFQSIVLSIFLGNEGLQRR
jgi:hypothetical protein